MVVFSGGGGKFMSFLLPFIWFASFVCLFNQVKEFWVCMGVDANSLQELMFPQSIIRGNGKHWIHTHWAKKKDQFLKLMKTHIIIIIKILKKLWVLGAARSRSYCSRAWFSPFKSCQSLLMISLTLWTLLKYIANTLNLPLSLSLSLSSLIASLSFILAQFLIFSIRYVSNVSSFTWFSFFISSGILLFLNFCSETWVLRKAK